MKKIILGVLLMVMLFSFVGCAKGNSSMVNSENCVHDWEYPNCTEPYTCSKCGDIMGIPRGHSLDEKGFCDRCGQYDRVIKEKLEKCSLELPSVPLSVSNYDVDGKVLNTYELTNLKYEFENSGENVRLRFYVSAKKTYDALGENMSSPVILSYKLYDNEGNVVESSRIISSVSVMVGESFKAQNNNYITPGAYKLVFADRSY